MISSEVQRTLVKSPPELWAELSDPDALGRHLGELGEIRITRAEPEKRVEWEAEGTSGSVLIKPSGWGTKVTLSVTREFEAPAQHVPELPQDTGVADIAKPEPEAAAEAVEPPGARAEIPEAEALAAPITEVAEPGSVEPEASALEAETPEIAGRETEATEVAAEAQPAPRRGLFARLFGRRHPKVAELVEERLEEPAAAVETDSAPIPSVEQAEASEVTIGESARSNSAIESLQARFQAGPAVEADPEPEAAPEPVAEADAPLGESQEEASEPPRDLAAELQAAEEIAAEEVTAVLTTVLDRLGAAHHRPFSRA
jgi:hypothetical protein